MTPRSDVAMFSNTKCEVVFEFVIFYLFISYDAAYSKHIMDIQMVCVDFGYYLIA